MGAEVKKKIMVCGSAGFLMSNLIRYLFYRSRDYTVIGIDNLCNTIDYKRMYIHKDCSFYIGDIADRGFVDKVVTMERPDIIVNGVNHCPNTFGPDVIVKGSFTLSLTGCPVIQLTPSMWQMDPNGWWNSAAMTANNSGGTVLELPNCFGFRQKNHDGFTKIIKSAVDNNRVEAYPHSVPWVYAEDVASMIWFLMEKLLSGKPLTHIRMPATYCLKVENIVKIIEKEFGLNKVEIVSNFREPICKSHEPDVVSGWSSDFDNIDNIIIKTIRWYKYNSWAL